MIMNKYIEGTLFERGVKVLNHASRVPLIECISGYNKLKVNYII